MRGSFSGMSLLIILDVLPQLVQMLSAVDGHFSNQTLLVLAVIFPHFCQPYFLGRIIIHLDNIVFQMNEVNPVLLWMDSNCQP